MVDRRRVAIDLPRCMHVARTAYLLSLSLSQDKIYIYIDSITMHMCARRRCTTYGLVRLRIYSNKICAAEWFNLGEVLAS